MRPLQLLTTQLKTRALHTAAASVTLTTFVAAQSTTSITTFSVDYDSFTVAIPDSFTGAPITEGDVLSAATFVPQLGPLAAPGTLETGGVAAPAGLGLGLHGPCVGHLPGTPCGVEVDALSHGMDRILGPTIPGLATMPHLVFSVERRSVGVPGFAPDVWDEGQCLENATDVYAAGFLPPMPVAPFPGQNVGFVDGNGLANCFGTSAFPGVGLIEPTTANGGDNLDALDMDVPDAVFPSTTCTFFSLDGTLFDPVTVRLGSGSAQAHGFLPGDVLVTNPGGVPALYASAAQLGLDQSPNPPGSDDLDALILWENGIAGYQRSSVPYDWTTGASDMLLFSVRRGSALVGVPDSIFGLPIQPGDVLTPTGAVGSVPGIWIAAEALGLVTFRFVTPVIQNGDDVDALDALQGPDAGTGYCSGAGTVGTCPCGNNGFPGRGCGNSSNGQGALLWGNGLASVSNDSVILHASGMPATTTCLLYQGTVGFASGAVFGDGLRCVGGLVQRFPLRTAWCGNRSFGSGVPGDPLLSVYFGIVPPTTLYYQVWYRDAAAFCTPNVFNLTNGYKISWTP